MDFGFLRASTTDFGQPNVSTDRVVKLFDGFESYLLIVDEASRHVWVFLTESKDPPTETATAFLRGHGHTDGGMIHCDQGGELARSEEFRTRVLKEYTFVVEPTGADDPAQNGGAETWNGTFAVTVRALLYRAALSAMYWSAALVHAVFLHNVWVHSRMGKTPYEAWYGSRPDLKRLRMFGARVCVKRTGKRRAKLDKHNFSGIFIGYTETMKNVRYVDLTTGLVKTCGHATFDEAWYCSKARPPAAQLLYDLGLTPDSDELPLQPATGGEAAMPPCHTTHAAPTPAPVAAKMEMLPLRLGTQTGDDMGRMLKMSKEERWAKVQDPYENTTVDGSAERKAIAAAGITCRDVTPV